MSTRDIRIVLLCAWMICSGWIGCLAWYDVQGWRHAKATGFFGRDTAITTLTNQLGVCESDYD